MNDSNLTINNTKDKVELFFSCKNLKNVDFITVSDPFIRFYNINPTNNSKSLIGETEKIDNNLNPDFNKSFIVNFFFELKQIFYIEVLDYDDDGTNTLLGFCQFTLADVICSIDGKLEINLNNNKKSNNHGIFIVKGEKVAKNNNIINMSLKVSGLKNNNCCLFSNSPFLCIYKNLISNYKKEIIALNDENSKLIEAKSNNLVLVYKSNIKSGNNIDFGQLSIKLSKLCSGDLDLPLYFKLYDYKRFSGNHQLIGECYASVNELFSKMTGNNIELPLVKSNNNREIKTGKLILSDINIKECYEFLDYLRNGLKIALHIGIDFTASNRDPFDPKSLHFVNAKSNEIFNPYKSAINQTGNILLDYDDDKIVPVYGFGSIPKFSNFSSNTVNHCFAITGEDINNYEGIKDLHNILKSYDNCLNNMIFSGPTYFGPLLQEIISKVKLEYMKDKYTYNFLLILTDGVIHDFDMTKNLIVEASYLPISIVIVGVGNEDFSKMNELDDCHFESYSGKKILRDIVKFVEFSKYSNDEIGLNEQVLHEIPDQVSEFYSINKIRPSNITVNNNIINKTFVSYPTIN